MNRYSVKRVSPLLTEIRATYKSVNDVFSFLLCSDVHFDNPKCDRRLFFSHLSEAKEKKAGILCFGDFFCLMQGKYDPRRNKSSVRPEHNKENYLDAVFSDSADKISDYAKNFLVISDGNHETAILKNCEVNPLDHLTEKLRYKYNSQVEHMGYHGFVRFVFENHNGGKIRKCLLYFMHGKYGGTVTKGVLGVNRHGLVVPQADIVVTGHTHDRWEVSQPRYVLRDNGVLEVGEQLHIKTGTYKEEFAHAGGWAVERIVMPKSLGGYWLELSPNLSGVNIRTYKT